MSQNIIHLTIVQNTLQIQYVHKHHNFWDLIQLTQFVCTGQLLIWSRMAAMFFVMLSYLHFTRVVTVVT